ncbi:hypothetical protein BaRGS_00017911, partial [Batillaria attramentaria]
NPMQPELFDAAEVSSLLVAAEASRRWLWIVWWSCLQPPLQVRRPRFKHLRTTIWEVYTEKWYSPKFPRGVFTQSPGLTAFGNPG